MRWIKRGLAAVAGLIVLALVVIYGGSEWVIRKGHEVPMPQIAVPNDAASLAEGARLAKIASCRDCHGPNGEGKVLAELPLGGRLVPPTLAKVAANLSDAELARVIRHGVHKDGSSIFIMPTHALGHISDDDLGKIIAWVRTLKPGPNDVKASNAFGPLGRFLVLGGMVPPQATAATVAEAHRPVDTGRYIVDIACQACHKLHEDGVMEDGKTKVPALAPMAASYDPAAFKRLLHTGVGMRPLGLMSEMAKNSFVALNDQEIAAIQTYLKREAEKTPAK